MEKTKITINPGETACFKSSHRAMINVEKEGVDLEFERTEVPALTILDHVAQYMKLITELERLTQMQIDLLTKQNKQMVVIQLFTIGILLYLTWWK
jgi:hypothetical protein